MTTTATFARQHLRRNYRLWMVETSAWVCATTFIDGTTVLPVLVFALSKSPVLVGLVMSIRYLGQGWPQLIATRLVSGKPRKPFFVRTVMIGRLALLWPGIMLLVGITAPVLTLPAILLAYLAFWISEGFSIVPWVDLLGQTTPPARRGRVFADMHWAGGALGLGGSLCIRNVLHARALHFPVNYGLLFLIAFAIISMSTLAIGFLREPPALSEEEVHPVHRVHTAILALLRANAQFRLLILLQALLGFALLPAPFYILFALQRVLPSTPSQPAMAIGLFLAVQTVGMVCGNALFSHIGDSHGNRQLLRLLACLHTLVPLWALLAAQLAHRPPVWLLYLALMPIFFAMGGLLTGTWLGIMRYLLDIIPEDDRRAQIPILNSLNITAVILPVIGGLLLIHVRYTMIFFIAAFFLFSAFLLTYLLEVPPPSGAEKINPGQAIFHRHEDIRKN